MISEIFCVSSRSETIFHKRYRFDIPDSTPEIFIKRLQEETAKKRIPHFCENNVHFSHIKRNNVYLVAVCKSSQPILVTEILSKLFQLLKDFCGSFNEDTLKANIILVYELLDEYMDYGFVQLSSVDKLKPFIQSEPVMMKACKTHQNMTSGLFGVEYRAPVTPDSAEKPVVRSQLDQESRQDEIFLDVIERIAVLMQPNGTMTRSELNGSINMKCFVSSGAPRIQIALNNDLLLNENTTPSYDSGLVLADYSLHNCVEKEKFIDSRELLIQPPQGEFTVMTYSLPYQCSQHPPIKISLLCKTITRDDIEVTVKLRSTVPDSAEIVNLNARIALPKFVKNVIPLSKGPHQTVQYLEKDAYILWSIKRIRGGQDCVAKFKVIPDLKTKLKQETSPISLDFEISGHVSSGLCIKYLRLRDASGHNSRLHRWIRYITVPDSYIINVSWM